MTIRMPISAPVYLTQTVMGWHWAMTVMMKTVPLVQPIWMEMAFSVSTIVMILIRLPSRACKSEPTLCTIDADGDGYGDVLPSGVAGDCLLLALVDTGRYWDVPVTITADGLKLVLITRMLQQPMPKRSFCVRSFGLTVVASYSYPVMIVLIKVCLFI